VRERDEMAKRKASPAKPIIVVSRLTSAAPGSIKFSNNMKSVKFMNESLHTEAQQETRTRGS
jgi:hypothetical protein